MVKKEEDFIGNLNNVRDKIETSFLISSVSVKKARTGNEYLEFTLTDKTGEIIARMFGGILKDENGNIIARISNGKANPLYESIDKGAIYSITGSVDVFPPQSNNYNIKINSIKRITEDSYDLDDYIRKSPKNQNELIDEITQTIAEMKNPDLKNLLKSFFDDEKFTNEFMKAPSAKIHHHNYLGGLLEHTVGVLLICKKVCEIFPQLDTDLLYAGAILHDIGKLKAYDYDILSIDISNQGKLLDHLFISCDMVKERIRINEIEIPEDLQTDLLHILLSHHGDVHNGWGSPVSPKTPEAVALHHADNLDAKVQGMIQNTR
jgi:3'-5' exoribonuclease